MSTLPRVLPLHVDMRRIIPDDFFRNLVSKRLEVSSLEVVLKKYSVILSRALALAAKNLYDYLRDPSLSLRVTHHLRFSYSQKIFLQGDFPIIYYPIAIK